MAFIFLVSGLSLPPRKLRANITNWRLHIVVQGISFILIPAIMLGAYTPSPSLFPPPLSWHILVR